MRLLVIIIFLAIQNLCAQTSLENNTLEKKGFAFGLGLGVGSIHLSTNDSIVVRSNMISTTLPNIKIGYMVKKNLELAILLPGANYKYKNKDRGFEGFMFMGQYWLKNKWWILGGTGLTFDAPAFYTVKDPKTAGFYTGIPSFAIATGYEILQKKTFTIDVQYRSFYGKSNVQNGCRQGVANFFILGFNWY